MIQRNILRVTIGGQIRPPAFDKTFMYILNKHVAPKLFIKLAKDFESVVREVETQIVTELRSRKVAIEGRRGQATPILPVKNIYQLYSWEVLRDGTQWIFRFGAATPEMGKDLRKMEYHREVQYRALKKDAPVRPGRPRREDYDVVTGGRALGLGPIRYAKHIHLETWDWEAGGGQHAGKYKRLNLAPFRAMCAQVFIDTIEKMNRTIRGMT